MEEDTPLEVQQLRRLAVGEDLPEGEWPSVLRYALQRLDKIALHDFPIPDLPRPQTRDQSTPPIRTPSHDSESDKENAADTELPETQPLDVAALPLQILDMLNATKNQLELFQSHPPHTIQRVAELILTPRAHYKALASYLHALDRVVQVTSGTDAYPLPPAISDLNAAAADENGRPSSGLLDRSSPPDSTAQLLGTDEALGGALLTPIPWLTRRSPESNGSGTPGAQIHSESTEVIEGPNGVGSIETVSVSVNGVPSTGHTRGVTQGELLRQEQRAGVVPVSQLSRAQDMHGKGERLAQDDEEDDEDEDEEAQPTHGGPDEIGVGDTGPQPSSAAAFSNNEGAMETQVINIEAAVGRKYEEEGSAETADEKASGADGDASAPSAAAAGVKRESEQDLTDDEAATKKTKDESGSKSDEDAPTPTSDAMAVDEAEKDTKEGAGAAAADAKTEDAMDTDKEAS